MSSPSERIISLYQRHAVDWDKERGRSLFEKDWLDRFLASLPQNASILDIGCGSAEPIARYLIERGCHLTGTDSSSALIGSVEARSEGSGMGSEFVVRLPVARSSISMRRSHSPGPSPTLHP